MAKLAIAGGAPVRTKSFTEWPQFDEREERGILGVLESRNWGGYPFPNQLAELFSQRFAAHQDAKHALCAANGTVTLEIALIGWVFIFATSDLYIILFGLGTLALGVAFFFIWSWRTARWPFAEAS